MAKETFTILAILFAFLSLYSCEQQQKKLTNSRFPAPLLLLDSKFTHHVLVAEKATHQLHLFKNNNGFPTFIRSYQMATGKKAGNKRFQGDFRTPEGIYQLIEFIPHETLIERMGKEGEIYGVGAFVLNYPNPIDRFERKSGGGIWLHSTNDETRIDKGLDSRGCFVVSNNELIEISTYIELNKTSIISVQDLTYLSKNNWEDQKENLTSFVSSWLKSWQAEDIEAYSSHYHPKEYYDHYRGNYQQFKQYKKAVFANPGAPTIHIDSLSIIQTPKYAIASFRQKYASTINEDIGKKILYLKKDEYYNWKIISEAWSKLPSEKDGNVAFSPSMRFFKEGEQK